MEREQSKRSAQGRDIVASACRIVESRRVRRRIKETRGGKGRARGAWLFFGGMLLGAALACAVLLTIFLH